MTIPRGRSLMLPVRHIAGPYDPETGYQVCRECGKVLLGIKNLPMDAVFTGDVFEWEEEARMTMGSYQRPKEFRICTMVQRA